MALYSIEDVLKNIFNDKTLWKTAEKIPLITKEIEDLKSDLIMYLKNSDCDIKSLTEEGRALYSESRDLIDEMLTCKEDIEQGTMADILKSMENYDHIKKELESVNFAINIIYDVVQCSKYVKDYEEGREVQSYSRAVEAVYDLLQFIEHPAEGFNYLDLCANVKQIAQLSLESLLTHLLEEWTRMINWDIKPGNHKTVVVINLTIEDTSDTIDLLIALNKCKKLAVKVSELSQFLLKDVLIPIVQTECLVYAENDENLTLTIVHREDFRPAYDTVISNLRVFFHYLSNKLNVEFKNERTIMTMISNNIHKEFSEILVQDCLIHTVPNNITELQSYGKITYEIEEFQQFLTLTKFFPRDKVSILHYVANIDLLFADKSSQYFLETARTIMLKDLSLSMSIGVENIPDNSKNTNKTPDENEHEEALNILSKTIPKSLFYFPRCMISKTAQELLDLVYMMMEQAVQCSDIVCKKLYNTTRLVFELYDAVVPYHHEDYLLTIPQYVALFHNNCMYLAHNLQTFGDKWLTLMEGRELNYPISFLDLVIKIRELGYKYLTMHLQQQRKQILDNIRASDLNCIVVKDVLSENAEAAIRQCLRQLQLLKNVWIGVFPSNVFTRLMATLVNMFVDELIHRVCTVEDISMEMATQLTEIYTLVVQKVPQLFVNKSDVEVHIKSWIKLKELIFVLSGSLKDIEKHWNEGKGPLAVHFRTEELRSLIKALFQNTQFRANLLSKIK